MPTIRNEKVSPPTIPEATWKPEKSSTTKYDADGTITDIDARTANARRIFLSNPRLTKEDSFVAFAPGAFSSIGTGYVILG